MAWYRAKDLPGFAAWAELRRPTLGAEVEAFGAALILLRPEWAREVFSLKDLDGLFEFYGPRKRVDQGEGPAANDSWPEPEAVPAELALERLPECPACGSVVGDGGHSCLEEDA